MLLLCFYRLSVYLLLFLSYKTHRHSLQSFSLSQFLQGDDFTPVRQGLLSVGWDTNDAFRHCIDHGIDQNVWQHSNIDELMKYLTLVNFVVKLSFLVRFVSIDICSSESINNETMFI